MEVALIILFVPAAVAIVGVVAGIITDLTENR